MIRACHWLLLLVVVSVTTISLAQQSGDATAVCSFADGKQISVRYSQPESKRKDGEIFGKDVPFGKPWQPGGHPIVLFTQTAVQLETVNLPIGAYDLIPVPEQENWKLEIKRPAATPGGTAENLGTATLGSGTLGQPTSQFDISFGRAGDRVCSMRMYWGKTGVWGDFKEQ